MAERDGSIHLQTVVNRKTATLKPLIEAKISEEAKEIVTDALSTYVFSVPKERHKPTKHKEELRDRDWTSTQAVENAFSLFKRGIVGNYHKLSVEHLDRYLGSFAGGITDAINRKTYSIWLC